MVFGAGGGGGGQLPELSEDSRSALLRIVEDLNDKAEKVTVKVFAITVNHKMIQPKPEDFYLYKLVRLTDSVNDPVSFKDLQQTLEEIIDAQGTILKRGDLTILRKRVNMGMGNSNPVEKVSFFNKRGGTVVFTSDQLRRDLPRDFSSQSFLLVCRRTDQESLKEANELFQEWAKAVSNQEQEINLSIL